MSAELTITISSVQEGTADVPARYKTIKRQRYVVPAKPPGGAAAARGAEQCLPATQQRHDALEQVTRRGRVVRKPARYEPVETVTDDFPASAYSTDSESETEA